MSRTQPRRHTHDAGDIVSGRLRLTLVGTGTPAPGLVLLGTGAWGAITPAMLGTGTPGAGNFLRGDGTWSAAGGGSGGTATVTVPNSRLEHEQTVAAVGVTPSSRVTVSLGAMDDSAENAADMLDVASIGALPGTDTLTILLAFSTPTGGAIAINWSAA
jgi:hypothetical protein